MKNTNGPKVATLITSLAMVYTLSLIAPSDSEGIAKVQVEYSNGSDIVGNLQWKMSTALKCLGRPAAQSSFFASSSVAIAKAALGGPAGARD